MAGARRALTQSMPPMSRSRSMRAEVSIPRSPTSTNPLEAEAVAQLGELGLERARVGGVAREGLHGHRAAVRASVSRPNTTWGRSGRWSRL